MADDKLTNNLKTPTVEDILSNNKLGTVGDNLDKISTRTYGPISTAIGDNFFGINHRQTPPSLQINKDYFGLTFFTRPYLNLTSENLRASRLLAPLLSTKGDSIPRIIRMLLDPRYAKTNINSGSTLVDPMQAFIPVLTNNLLSISGWRDVVAPISTSQEGVYKESFSMVDGITADYTTYDITANFRNLPGDPITALFFAWVHYASLVYEGRLIPYPDALISNEIDYQTRIYRLVLDSTKTRVQKIAACGAAFPVSCPIGAAFNFESDKPINSSNDQISINFNCTGAMYQDDILIYEFNKVVSNFNPGMRDTEDVPVKATDEQLNSTRTRGYTKVPLEALSIFNNTGYPHINKNNYELEWWVPNDIYAQRLPNFKEHIKDGSILVPNNTAKALIKG
jgi:hypothetical protein